MFFFTGKTPSDSKTATSNGCWITGKDREWWAFWPCSMWCTCSWSLEKLLCPIPPRVQKCDGFIGRCWTPHESAVRALWCLEQAKKNPYLILVWGTGAADNISNPVVYWPWWVTVKNHSEYREEMWLRSRNPRSSSEPPLANKGFTRFRDTAQPVTPRGWWIESQLLPFEA